MVRQAKQEQADKELIGKEVEKLLSLKKCLAAAQGKEPEPPKTGKGKKKNKKK